MNSSAPENQAECGIRISVRVQYLELDSQPEKGNYAFAYTISISNDREDTVKLLNRHWFITDENNNCREVSGKGVVGRQPVIPPGGTFEYSSGAVIDTEAGFMKGYYTMQAHDGDLFDAPIPTFMLAPAHLLH